MREDRTGAKKTVEEAEKNLKFVSKNSYNIFFYFYQVGDVVVRYNRRRDTRMGDNLAPRYTGPYHVIEELGHGVYRIADQKGPLKQTANAINLKKWKDRDVPAEGETKDCHEPSSNDNDLPNNDDEASEVVSHEQNMSCDVTMEKKKRESTEKKDGDMQEWVPELHLKMEDRNLIRSGGWLNDCIVDAVNTIVTQHIGSEQAQTVNLSQRPGGFDVVTTETIMILHDRDHWITTACLGGKVLYMDSMRGNISKVVRCVSCTGESWNWRLMD